MPTPETNPRTNGSSTIAPIAATLCSSGFIVQSRVHGTTVKNSPASRQYRAKKRGNDTRGL